jgi:hypothetical protein
MRRLSIIAWMSVAALLAACSGGSRTIIGTPTTTTPGGGGATVSKVSVAASPATIAADGSTTSSITATALDANNAGVSGAAVTFSTTAGGAIAVVTGTTDTTGKATATLSNVSATAGTNLTVSAKIGGVSGSATVGVVAIQQSLSVQTDQPQIPSDASKPANISAVLRDANNNALAGTTVHFSATSGVLAVTQAVTDANGIAKATLAAGTDPTNRTITVTASAGSATAQVTVAVTGTTLTLTGPANLVLNNSGSCSVVLTNSAGQGIASTPVTVSSAKGNMLSATTLTTDSSGRASFTLKGTVGGTDTITATAQGLTQTISVAVSTQSFNITAPADGTKVNLGIANAKTVTVTWLNNGAAVVGQQVTFAATRGALTLVGGAPLTPVTTDANGNASVSISSNGAGPSIVVATATGVAAQLNLDFVALAPGQISVQAGPAAVAVQGQSTISALVRDSANNLVEGATVNFQVVTDPTNGQLSVASATTDAQGRAQSVYTAGNSSSGANGVTISATVAGVAPGTAALTVGGQAVFLSLGTGNTIDVGQGVAVYQITYTVLAVDSQGAALGNVPITVSVLPVAYGKGAMGGCPAGKNWVPVYSTLTTDKYAYSANPSMCLNEDTDYTGNISSLDSGPASTCTDLATNAVIPSHAKDYNCNGKLDPGNVAVVSPSSGTTDATGRLDVKVTYPRDHAYWVEVTLVASTKVQGTQSSTSSTFVLQGAVADYACAIGPPGPVSPYGFANTCANPN